MPIDSRVRERAEVVSVVEVGGGWWQVVTRFTLEVEGDVKPCFVGDSVTRVMALGEALEQRVGFPSSTVFDGDAPSPSG